MSDEQHELAKKLAHDRDQTLNDYFLDRLPQDDSKELSSHARLRREVYVLRKTLESLGFEDALAETDAFVKDGDW
jgi:hypothetical protein